MHDCADVNRTPRADLCSEIWPNRLCRSVAGEQKIHWRNQIAPEGSASSARGRKLFAEIWCHHAVEPPCLQKRVASLKASEQM
jgi:Fe-S-cluster-containing dehydrogenase component